MGAGAFHGRVRKGNGCSHPAITTRSAKRNFGPNLADLARFEKLVKFSLRFVYLNTSLDCSCRMNATHSAGDRHECFRIQPEMSTGNGNDQANRAISTGKLHALPHFHTRPINVVVFHGSDREHSFPGWFPA